MSQIARVFVVLNLLVAAGFLFSASTFLAKNDDYMGKWNAEKAAHEQTRINAGSEKQKLLAQLDDVSRQHASSREEGNRLKGETDSQRTQVSSLEAGLRQKDMQLAELTRVNNEHATAVQNLRADNSRLVEANTALDKAQRDAVAKQVEAETALNEERKKNMEAENKIADLEKDVASQLDTINQKDLMIAYAKSKGIDFEKIEIAPPLQGVVVNADNNLKLVLANIGSENGVTRGNTLDIVRGGTYIGRFRVDTVYPKTCAGTIELLAQGQQVMIGDRVTNTLN
jgi:peptidoglycan hydrolase CwlO-like protein